MSENTEDTGDNLGLDTIHPVDGKSTTGALASWESPHLSLRERLKKHWRQMLARLWGPTGSLVFHVIVIGLLVVLTTLPTGSTVISKEVYISPPSPPPEKLDPTVTPPNPTPTTTAVNPLDNPQDDVSAVPNTDAHDLLQGSGLKQEGLGLGSGDPKLLEKGFDFDNPTKSRLKMTNLYSSRSASGRLGLGHPPGCRPSELTEASVLRALRWLKKNQDANGSWPGSKMNVPPAMTSMALLAYLGHDEKTDSPEFGATVKKALVWMLANQKADGSFEGRDVHDYTQPICAYALCEAYGMTQHPSLHDAAVKAVALVVKGQHGSGGFNYNLDAVTERNDSSYMAWCCQALESAKMAGLTPDLPELEMTIKKAVLGFKQNAAPNGGFGYIGPGTSGLSGAGALCMLFLGNATPPPAEVKKTMRFLAPAIFSFADWQKQPYNGDNSSPLYYWYYITQAKFQYSTNAFTQWNKMFSPELCRTQIVEKNGILDATGKPAEIGHWESPSPGEHSGGLVQDTCLCTLMLEVYYRYLPSYQRVETATDGVATKPDDKDVVIKMQL